MNDIKTHEDDPIISYREAGGMIGKSHGTISNWVRDGLLEAVRFSPNDDNSKILGVRKNQFLSMLAGAGITPQDDSDGDT